MLDQSEQYCQRSSDWDRIEVSRQVLFVYSSGNAGKLRSSDVMISPRGFQILVYLDHRVRDIAVLVHGDHFTTLSTDADPDWYGETLGEPFGIILSGHLGKRCIGASETRILNRVVFADSSGPTYEADPRQRNLLVSSLKPNPSNSYATPGVRPNDRDEFAIKKNEPSEAPLPDYSDTD